MTHELKFRAWDSYLKKMVAVGFHVVGEVTVFGMIDTWVKENRCEKPLLVRYDDMIITQYIISKDINGKDLYDGDIITLSGSPYFYEIVWNGYGWGIDSKGVVSEHIQPFTSAISTRAILAGNIFENRELISKKHE